MFLILLGCLAAFAPRVHAQGTLPVVAIHDSETTRALESMPASAPTPMGAGTTGYQWWPTNWHYFVMPEAAQEMLRSDGTPFAVIRDSDITAGLVLPNGAPKYPIVISLASEAMQDSQITPLANYVASGGFLVVGSSSFTRNPNGTSRGDFALANQMGLHMVSGGLANWSANVSLTKQGEHRLTSHIPSGTLTWRMPSSAEEISWGLSPGHVFEGSHAIWQVQASDATIIAQGDNYPTLAVKKYGKGYFIYCANFQPLIAHGGFGPGMYAYALFRNAIEWAYESAQLPVVKLSPWPYQYDAAFMIRHDLENYSNSIALIESSAQYEFSKGVRGDYYFCTGTLREDMSNDYDVNAVIASLQRAMTTYGATISTHNGGLGNPSGQGLGHWSYDFWHWGLDEALDATAAGYPNGKAYAQASLLRSFQDIEGWLPGLMTSDMRVWVSPLFNSTREDSYVVQEQLNVKVAGDQKLGPFPHWTVSTRTSGKRYPILSQPVSDWFVDGMVAQSLEPWHPPGVHTSETMHQAVDFYYNKGALINFYSHTLATGEGGAGLLVPDYIDYCTDASRFPRMWSANAIDLYNWWIHRGTAQIGVNCTTNGGQITANISVSGASDINTTVELLLPAAGAISDLRVYLNGVQATGKSYRVNGRSVKVRVGTDVSNAQVIYSLVPVAVTDFYSASQGTTLTVAAPGVLANDQSSTTTSATAVLENGPAHGTLTLNANGGFSYTPANGFSGTDGFTYRARAGQANSEPGMVIINVKAPGTLFSDDFTRSISSGELFPWIQQSGSWNIANGMISGTSPAGSYGNAYYDDGSNWADYKVSARIQFSSIYGLGAGVGGRLNPATGSHYAAWVYPEGSPGGASVMKLVKFEGWVNWSGSPMAIVQLPSVGTTPHLVELTFQGANISVSYDGAPVISASDNNFDGVAPFMSGGISLDMYTDSAFTFSADDVAVTMLLAPPAITSQPTSRTVNAGSSTTFTVGAQGSSLSYQWKFNGNIIAGATSSSYTRSNVQTSDAGDYTVVVSNPAGSVISTAAKLTVNVPPPPAPPTITTQPQSLTVISGENATFSVTASGSGLRYQWRLNGFNIAGATNSSLTITNARTNGSYAVVVSNDGGIAISTAATLFINYRLTILSDAGGSVAIKPAQASYAPGTEITLTAWPDLGYKFTGWSGDASGNSNPMTITINSNMTIRAGFSKNLLGKVVGIVF